MRRIAPFGSTTLNAPRLSRRVTKVGHIVIETPDFDVTARWYMDTLGVMPSDVMCLADGTPVGAFMRLDRGSEPTDHHTLFLATGLESKVDHVAFEVVDLDAVEMGQQILMAKRYRHAWGVGRHLLGSQIFDYWRDPWGQKHEHYADGDLFDAAHRLAITCSTALACINGVRTCLTTSLTLALRRGVY
jgi:hypothetical protein